MMYFTLGAVHTDVAWYLSYDVIFMMSIFCCLLLTNGRELHAAKNISTRLFILKCYLSNKMLDFCEDFLVQLKMDVLCICYAKVFATISGKICSRVASTASPWYFREQNLRWQQKPCFAHIPTSVPPRRQKQLFKCHENMKVICNIVYLVSFTVFLERESLYVYLFNSYVDICGSLLRWGYHFQRTIKVNV